MDYTSPSINTTAETWTNLIATGRALLENPYARGLNGSNTSGHDSRFDDLSVKALTFSTCIERMGNPGHKSGTFQCTPTVTRGTIAGLLFNYKDIDNFSVVWIEGINAKLESCIAGVWTTVKTGNIAANYGAGRVLKAIVNGTTVQLFYHGTQVSTDGTIDNSGLGTEVWAFSTYASNTVGTVTTSKAVS